MTLNLKFTFNPFTFPVIIIWNKLPVDVLPAPSVFAFINRLKHSYLDKVHYFVFNWRQFLIFFFTWSGRVRHMQSSASHSNVSFYGFHWIALIVFESRATSGSHRRERIFCFLSSIDPQLSFIICFSTNNGIPNLNLFLPIFNDTLPLL